MASFFLLITQSVTGKIFSLFFLYLHYVAVAAFSSGKGQQSRPLSQPGVSSFCRQALTKIYENRLEKLALEEPSKAGNLVFLCVLIF